MTAPVPLCVIGCGSIGLRHAQVAQASDAIELTAVVEPEPARRSELNALGMPVVAAIEEVPAKTRAAIIATPTPDHKASGLAAIAQGWAVLIEKPIGATLAETDELCRAAAKAGLPIFTGHHRRCHPFSLAGRERLGDLGKLIAVQCLWSLRKHDEYFEPEWRRSPGAGPIMTNLSHEIDLLRFLTGEIDELTSLTSNAARGLAVEDTAAMAMRFENGALGTVTLSDAGASPWTFEGGSGENPALAASGQDATRFIGERGALSFPSLTLWHSADGNPDWRKPLRSTEPEPSEPIDPILAQMERFAHIVQGRDDNVLATGDDGRKTLEWTLAAARSAQTCRPVRTGDVPLEYRGIIEGDHR